jgi:hypothetical protein
VAFRPTIDALGLQAAAIDPDRVACLGQGAVGFFFPELA